MDSSGPDVKIRGTVQHICEKYQALARDAQSSGDRIAAENYLQHAEHYYRLILQHQSYSNDEARQNGDARRSESQDNGEEGEYEEGGDGAAAQGVGAQGAGAQADGQPRQARARGGRTQNRQPSRDQDQRNQAGQDQAPSDERANGAQDTGETTSGNGRDNGPAAEENGDAEAQPKRRTTRRRRAPRSDASSEGGDEGPSGTGSDGTPAEAAQ